VDLVAAVVANEEPLEVVQVSEGALDNPPIAAEPGSVRGLSAGDLGLDAPLPQQAPVLVVVVAAVGSETVGAPPGPADLAAHRRDAIDQRDQLGDVVAVPARDRPGKRDPAAVDKEMVL